MPQHCTQRPLVKQPSAPKVSLAWLTGLDKFMNTLNCITWPQESLALSLSNDVLTLLPWWALTMNYLYIYTRTHTP